jgi:hypothetical protein
MLSDSASAMNFFLLHTAMSMQSLMMDSYRVLPSSPSIRRGSAHFLEIGDLRQLALEAVESTRRELEEAHRERERALRSRVQELEKTVQTLQRNSKRDLSIAQVVGETAKQKNDNEPIAEGGGDQISERSGQIGRVELDSLPSADEIRTALLRLLEKTPFTIPSLPQLPKVNRTRSRRSLHK